MSGDYRITCRAINGVWHARCDQAPHLVASGDDPISMTVDIQNRLAALLGKNVTVKCDVKGPDGLVNMEAIRLVSMTPALDAAAIRPLIERHGLTAHTEQLLANLLPAATLTTRRLRANETLPPGSSHVGGDPNLPPASERPTSKGRPLTLLAQINLTDLASATALSLPDSGSLLFWYDEESLPHGTMYGEADGSCRVTYLDNHACQQLRPHQCQALQHHPCAVAFRPCMSLPNISAALSIDDTKRFYALQEEVAASHSGHQLRGHHDAPGYNVEGERPADTELLLRLSHDPDGPGWSWYDARTMYFWIRRADLDRSDFDNVWCTIE